MARISCLRSGAREGGGGGGMLSSCDSKQLDFCKDRSILSVEVEAKMLQTVAMQLVRVSAVLFACFL